MGRWPMPNGMVMLNLSRMPAVWLVLIVLIGGRAFAAAPMPHDETGSFEHLAASQP